LFISILFDEVSCNIALFSVERQTVVGSKDKTRAKKFPPAPLLNNTNPISEFVEDKEKKEYLLGMHTKK
jgi:hypothetical protein